MTDATELAFTSATELAAAIGRGELTSASLVSTLLERIELLDPKLHAFVDVYADDARQAAGAADAARAAGHAVGPFHGIPVAVKDIVDIQGRVTTGGSKAWVDRVSPLTATIVTRMQAAGMIVLGKTHTVEFAMGSFGTNQHMGTPWNPWDANQHRAPGGSSAGSGVAVAAGLAPWAIGTDTGGSVRLPSAWCGLTGLKTTKGQISCHGVLPLSHTLDTPGPMCRSVEDAAVLYEILAGRDANDRSTFASDAREHPVRHPRDAVAGLTLARLNDEALATVEPPMRAAYDTSLAVLSDLGAKIVTVDLPHSFSALGALTGTIIGAEGFGYVGHLTENLQAPIDEAVRPRIGIGRDMKASVYIDALKAMSQCREDFERALIGVDAVLTPGAESPAPIAADIDQSGTAAQFTRPFNFIELCALVLPNGYTAAGLPLSLQIACRGRREGLALRIGGAYQHATDWHRRHPSEVD
jgi:aspartyl-tRNA(Asn)/glutamyl-tRNA(Gln) amidotransferase subunit A